jgi:hypothetical protein
VLVHDPQGPVPVQLEDLRRASKEGVCPA